MIRYLRSFFFGEPGNSYKKFSTGNKPNESMFRKLFNSMLFASESDDAASTSSSGHVRTATDANAKLRADADTDGFTRVVKPHQLPLMEGADGTQADTIATDVEEGGLILTPVNKVVGSDQRMNFRISVNPDHSLEIDAVDKKLQLDGDETTPGNYYFYGKMAGSKGWLRPIPDYTGLGAINYYLRGRSGAISWQQLEADAASLYIVLDNVYGPGAPAVGVQKGNSYTIPAGTIADDKAFVRVTSWFEFVNAGLNENYVQLNIGNGMVGWQGPRLYDGNTTGKCKLVLEVHFNGIFIQTLVLEGAVYDHQIPSNVYLFTPITINPVDPITEDIEIYEATYIRMAGAGGDILTNHFLVELFKSQ